ncbi:hypothetical protein AB4Z55_27330 [Gordonia sp. ABKF26]|uniref:hypothetical protein n=1 Tax=Gordonia sp. ABKF26 TaxID=3238687 RepID=UPI0034E476F5
MHIADRGRREALVLFALLATAVLVFGVVTVVTGDEEPDQTFAAPILESMPTAPEMRWTADAGSLFGNEFRDAGVVVPAADDDVVIVQATQTAIGKPSALQALDPDTGRPLWDTPRIGWDDGCALSGDGQLACTRRVRVDGAVATRVSFLDPRTGTEETAALIRTAGSVTTLTGVGDGFLVETNDIENVVIPEEHSASGPPKVEYRLEVVDDPPDRQMTITKFDSQGHQAWSIQPPVNQDRAVVSDAGNLFAVSDTTRGGFTICRLDTGTRVFSRTDSESGTPPDAAVLHPSGFVTSRSDRGDDRVMFFDADGVRTGELAGWRVVPGNFEQITTVDGDELALSSGAAVGIASIQDRAMRWDTGMSKHSLRLLDDQYAAIESDDYAQGSTGTWTVFDAQTGDQRGQATIGYGQRYLGFDGTRLLFDGDPTANHRPNVPILSAYDAETGRQSWRLPAPTDTAQWQVTGPYLLLIDYTADFISHSVTRYAP